ncbi:MAG: SPASM domain-containing protein [Candidatus Theseobacter exili]|nr:SPASM domain-containing protein [Candidatus Theseobacter exili]
MKKRIAEKYRKWKLMRNLSLTKISFFLFLLNNAMLFLAKKRYQQNQFKAKRRFLSVAIETYGGCNRKCSFCFNNDRFPKREAGVLEWDSYKKVIDELASIKFAGRISPHFYGEPLLDERIIEFVKYARKKCKHASITFSTNGDFLTEYILRELIISGVDRLNVSDYEETKQLRLKELKDKYPYWIDLRVGGTPSSYSNRAGKIFERENNMLHHPCLRPSSQLVINWKGEVLLCCNDFYAKHIFGNISDLSIFDIWNSPDFQKIRTKLQKHNSRQEYDFCKGCDMLGNLCF